MKNTIDSKYYSRYLLLLNHLSDLKDMLNQAKNQKEEYSQQFIADLIRSNRLELIKILVK